MIEGFNREIDRSSIKRSNLDGVGKIASLLNYNCRGKGEMHFWVRDVKCTPQRAERCEPRSYEMYLNDDIGTFIMTFISLSINQLCKGGVREQGAERRDGAIQTRLHFYCSFFIAYTHLGAAAAIYKSYHAINLRINLLNFPIH